MTQTDKKNYKLLATEESVAPPPSYEAAASASEAPNTVQFLRAQPSATARMLVGGARNSMAQEVGLDGMRDWNHELCSCHEAPALTAAACFCPCLVYSANRSRLTHLAATGQPNPAPQHIGLWCGLYALAPQLGGIGQAAMQFVSRFQTRQRYSIRGNMVEDALIGTFCTTCSLVQEARELQDEEEALQQQGAAEVPAPLYRDEEDSVGGAE
ncbi:hypothetical protein BMF94_0854 [Rhodotorula taiwanensis]|uniref:PLAC8 family protein n=1 Tax=Rhodotorula taiwanensis TaxID=741276 RepID=A0A2S5BH87_9BASI|nr:hypothetical protein BMF94_0854 [Rhodotorula taiwanensis]